jgi:hypothetical protein
MELLGASSAYHTGQYLARAGLGALRAQLDEFWTQALANYKAAAEQRNEEGA